MIGMKIERDYRLLLAIYKFGGSVKSLTKAALTAGIVSGGAYTSAKRLAADGLLAVEKADGRANSYSLTEKGMRLAALLIEIISIAGPGGD